MKTLRVYLPREQADDLKQGWEHLTVTKVYDKEDATQGMRLIETLADKSAVTSCQEGYVKVDLPLEGRSLSPDGIFLIGHFVNVASVSWVLSALAKGGNLLQDVVFGIEDHYIIKCWVQDFACYEDWFIPRIRELLMSADSDKSFCPSRVSWSRLRSKIASYQTNLDEEKHAYDILWREYIRSMWFRSNTGLSLYVEASDSPLRVISVLEELGVSEASAHSAVALLKDRTTAQDINPQDLLEAIR